MKTRRVPSAAVCQIYEFNVSKSNTNFHQHMEETYIQLSVLVQASLQLLGRKALREHSLPDSAHVQLSLALAGSSGATVAHSADQVENLRAR